MFGKIRVIRNREELKGINDGEFYHGIFCYDDWSDYAHKSIEAFFVVNGKKLNAVKMDRNFSELEWLMLSDNFRSKEDGAWVVLKQIPNEIVSWVVKHSIDQLKIDVQLFRLFPEIVVENMDTVMIKGHKTVKINDNQWLDIEAGTETRIMCDCHSGHITREEYYSVYYVYVFEKSKSGEFVRKRISVDY